MYQPYAMSACTYATTWMAASTCSFNQRGGVVMMAPPRRPRVKCQWCGSTQRQRRNCRNCGGPLP